MSTRTPLACSCCSATAAGDYVRSGMADSLTRRVHASIVARESNRALADLGSTLTVAHAYAIQHAIAQHRVATGESTYGYKVGCTSRAVREKFGIAESIYGRLWTSEQRVSGAVLHARDYATLAIEGELACTIVDMAGGSSTERWVVDVSPIIELHHAEWHCDVSVRAAELVAKNGIHAGVVHYNALRKPQHRFTLGDPALLDIPITVTIDGEVVEAPSLRALELGGKQGPLATISWLAQRLEADGCGEQMKVGDVVLTATPGSLIRVDAESSVRVEFDGMVTECTVVE